MENIRIAVLCSGGGTNLQAILDAKAAGNLPDGEIVLVVADSEAAYALERAKRQGIPAAVFDKHVYSRAAREQAILAALGEKKIGLVVLAGFMTVLSADFVKAYEGRIVNIHPALLPSFGGVGMYGLHVHEAVLAAGVKVTGATVHYVTEVCDGGPIIAQKAVEVREGDTPETLQRRVMREAEWIIYPQAIEQVCKKLKGE